jgi:hypothetical protein
MIPPQNPTIDRMLVAAERGSLLWHALMREGMALLIRDRLARADASRQIHRPELLILTQLRQSNMATLDGTPGAFTLTMLGIAANAPSLRGALQEWATQAILQGTLT